ncbi:peptidase C14 caspase catalytic subunit p20 [Calothrix parasitica NIES-267]|uniref:Peptidase C14 caspase catalytic subunit p20 n=1 Tax=Calothrix parasitica NIES-267 TaxID=1973488 RepID=A0A1Z4LWH0_9CYAN|nr:peptidase C14 caspase catalytic subunit p20 [Calothrix parasitica NIES-267]
MQLNKKYQSLISQLSQLSDEQFQKDYLNHLEWTESIASILPLIDDSEALRVVRLGLDVDLILGAFLAGKVKPELQKETVGWIENLEILDNLKVELLGRTKSELAIPFLARTLNQEEELIRATVDMERFFKGEIEEAPEKELFYQALNYEQLSIQTAYILGSFGGESSTNLLIEALSDKRKSIRASAVEALGNINDELAITALIEASKNEDEEICSRAIHSLGETGSDLALEVLITALNHQKKSIAEDAVRALGKIAGEVAVEALIHFLLDEDDRVCKSCAAALVEIGNERGISILFSFLNHDDVNVRQAAVYGLRDIHDQHTLSALLPLLQDEDIRVRQEAVFAVGHIISPFETAEKTVNQFSENQRFNLAIAILKTLDNEDEELRQGVAFVLERIADESTLPILIEALQHNNPEIKACAARLLGIIGNPKVSYTLFPLLQDKNPSARVNAARALAKLGDESVIPLLTKMLAEEKNPSAREIVILGLGETRNPKVIPEIIEILQEKNPSAREIAIRALQNIGGESAEAAIIDVLLKDQDYIVCDKAAYALGVIGGEKSVVALRQALSNPSGGCAFDPVLETIVEALGKIGSDTAIEAILEPLPTDTCLDSFATLTLFRFGSLKNVPQLWNIQIKAKDKTCFCDAIEEIQLKHQRYNPNFD